MPTAHNLPGSPDQRALLQTVAAAYSNDMRVLAVILFGSLGRGNGDEYSDLDVVVIVRDDAVVDIASELVGLRAALAQNGIRTLLTQAAGNAVYLTTETLASVAIDYAKLRETPWYLLAGYLVLSGTVDPAAIESAAKANEESQFPPHVELHRALWLALIVNGHLYRGSYWPALSSLNRMRGALLEIFTLSRNGRRSARFFDTTAGLELKAMIGRTLPAYFPTSPAQTVASLSDALLAVLDILEYHLADLSNGQVELGTGERELVLRLRARQAALRNAVEAGDPAQDFTN